MPIYKVGDKKFFKIGSTVAEIVKKVENSDSSIIISVVVPSNLDKTVILRQLERRNISLSRVHIYTSNLLGKVD